MRKKLLLALTILAVIAVSAFLLLSGTSSENLYITSEVQRGPFEVLVYSSGQLEAQNSENVSGLRTSYLNGDA